ncbi:MAG: hypothetical protein DA408_12735 [Bacteroidetes bacterium]|nr:MAG: hypothetical protein C7N36_04165 [Bacteroidota bacterium]PTM11795.1 MAG: hypothetical protein DA408_12735 [Bacteroidota bacterium]
MTRLCLLSFALFFTIPLSAQQLQLDGLWEGTITVGGITSTKGYPVQIYLERSGRKVTGRSYVYLSKNRVVEMNMAGHLYEDLSIYIDEVTFVDRQKDGYVPPFLRKYQLSWNRSINGSSLNGYWQEDRKEIFAGDRERGRIFLKKVVSNKA